MFTDLCCQLGSSGFWLPSHDSRETEEREANAELGFKAGWPHPPTSCLLSPLRDPGQGSDTPDCCVLSTYYVPYAILTALRVSAHSILKTNP